MVFILMDFKYNVMSFVSFIGISSIYGHKKVLFDLISRPKRVIRLTVKGYKTES